MNDKYWKDMEDMFSVQERLNKFFEQTESDQTNVLNQPQYTRMPPFDIYELETEYVVNAEVPGVSEKDLDISIDNNVLIIKGERRSKKDPQREYFHLMERSYGKFSRSFSLSEMVEYDSINAKLKDGLLTIHVPKIRKT